MARDDNYFQSLFEIQTNNFNEFRHEMRADLRDVWTELKEIKEDVSDVKDDVANVKNDVANVKNDVREVKNEVKDMKLTVTNHINSEIGNSNKKSLNKTPNWILLFVVFFFGRISFEIIDIFQNGSREYPKLESQSSTFAPPSSTEVASSKKTKDLNKEINKKILKKIDGLIE